MLHSKFQPNIPSHYEEKVDFICFAIFSISGHLGFSTMLNFIIPNPEVFQTLKFGNAACEI